MDLVYGGIQRGRLIRLAPDAKCAPSSAAALGAAHLTRRAPPACETEKLEGFAGGFSVSRFQPLRSHERPLRVARDPRLLPWKIAL